MSGQFIPVKSENKNPEGAANLIRKLQLIQEALINKPSTTGGSEGQETPQREETEVEPLRPGRRRKGKKKRRNGLQEARNTLEESGETEFEKKIQQTFFLRSTERERLEKISEMEKEKKTKEENERENSYCHLSGT